jgi:acetyltransferase-like isoleucine patch superfamily enzyme
MKAVKETGSKKTTRFILYSIFGVLLHRIINHLLFFPPIRKFFFQIVGAKIGSDSIIMDIRFLNWHHKGPGGLTIGERCFLGDETLIDLYDSVTLEDDVTLAQRVLVLTHTNVGYKDHPLQKYFPKSSKPVVFKKGSFIGANSTILPGVTIGECSFIAAGSVVTLSVPKESVYAGVPAKLIRKIK